MLTRFFSELCRRLRLGGRDEGLHEVVDVEGDALAVAAACGEGDEGAVLVGDTDEALRHLVVVDGLAGFGNEMVAQTGADEKLYVVADAEGEHSVAVAHGGKGQVGQGEDGSTLADIGSVDMARTDGHLSLGIAFAHLGELYAVVMGEDVGLVEFF